MIIKDFNQNEYNTVRIGNQIWFAKNLNVCNYKTGEPIMYAKSNKEWSEFNQNGIGAYRFYDDKPENEKICGKLYNWFAINDFRGLAPIGSHISKDTEWSELVSFIGGNTNGAKLKDINSKMWILPNTNASDDFGFSVLPCGYCSYEGFFYFWLQRILLDSIRISNYVCLASLFLF